MKLKLNIELNDEKYSVNAIKNDNKYIYNYKDSIITNVKMSDITKKAKIRSFRQCLQQYLFAAKGV